MIMFLQLGAALPSSPLELINASTGATKVVLALLVILSLVSWAIMLGKWIEFRRIATAGHDFADAFHRSRTLDDATAITRDFGKSPHAEVMTRAIRFVEETTPALAATSDRSARLSSSQVEALRLVLDAEIGSVRERLSRFVPSLATIGSVSPLIGLLGTVLGVIDAFLGIAEKGSGNIAAVAPGVAEALIATAAALSVAIPAVFGYNIFANRLNRIDTELEAFASELIALLVREGRI
ncbi:MAG: MotA/TolQ/ExbB proton channel family protein [Gemmatimonadaceae bacterium]|nr:MotA/TolQ/ExbB proton channel family protein [Gemmatimonadaceae bacterium]